MRLKHDRKVPIQWYVVHFVFFFVFVFCLLFFRLACCALVFECDTSAQSFFFNILVNFEKNLCFGSIAVGIVVAVDAAEVHWKY